MAEDTAEMAAMATDGAKIVVLSPVANRRGSA
jgi:hypothetical protein